MSVSLYDLLDVDEDASAEVIRAAWKSAIADLDPTDRRFRAYNDAAAVLLDADKRAAYDAELGATLADSPVEGPPAVAASPQPDESVETTAPRPAGRAEEDGRTVDESGDEGGDDATVTAVVEEPAAEPDADEDKVALEDPDSGSDDEAGVPTWPLLVAAAVAVLSVALLIVVLTWPGSLGGVAPADKADRAEDAAVAVEDAAAQAVPAVLSYDYRTFDADVEEAASYLTEDFAEERAELLDNLRSEVERRKVVVSSVVAGTSVTRVSEDGSRAVVLVFFDQESRRGRDEPRVLQAWASLSLVADGDEWLIDDICTQEDCS